MFSVLLNFFNFEIFLNRVGFKGTYLRGNGNGSINFCIMAVGVTA